jgi:dTDP-4-amino-4,6-dideoxygalactose transaminase
MADMIEIEKIALKNNLHIIEDSAQSHGASISGRPAGSFGLGSFSFYATKNLTTGEGGVITTNDGDLADALRILRNQGMRNKYEYVMEGNNYRLTDLQAALVIPQLKSYDSVVQKRKKNAATLSEKLQDIELITLPKELDNRSHVWHQYTILLDHNVRRDEFVKSMAANDVGVGVYYPSLVSDYELYRNHDRVVSNDVNVARDIASRVVSLPVHTKLKKKDFIQIANATRASLGINR